MKKLSLLVFLSTLFNACNTSPEKTFGIAALNCNLLYGITGSGMQQQLASPSIKLIDEKTMATAPMKRKEVIENKITQLQENYEKVKALSINDDNKEMIGASLSLYEFTLPILKKEYTELALLYDSNAPKEKVEALGKNICDNYQNKFEELYDRVIKSRTAYGEKHGIQVRTINPSPSK